MNDATVTVAIEVPAHGDPELVRLAILHRLFSEMTAAERANAIIFLLFRFKL